jgi:4-diphosphocytidyl-2-C-methyl-D-erythritol kinase
MLREKLVLEAPAKINLYLEVGPTRPDGYHAVRTVMQTVELCDLVEMEITSGAAGIELDVVGEAPGGEDNLCHKAAETFIAATGLRLGVRIKLTKDIPPAAGLGGGSSDAAAVLRALNFHAGEALSREELLGLAATLGSDVPFFLVGGTALGEGRGERITPLVQAPPLLVVLAKPAAGLATADVYGRFDTSGGDEPPPSGPGPLIEALPGGDVAVIARLLHNSLQKAARELMPEVGSLLRIAGEASGGGALVSGSGPTVFVLAADDGQAAALEKKMRDHAAVFIKTRFRGAGVSRPDQANSTPDV